MMRYNSRYSLEKRESTIIIPLFVFLILSLFIFGCNGGGGGGGDGGGSDDDSGDDDVSTEEEGTTEEELPGFEGVYEVDEADIEIDSDEFISGKVVDARGDIDGDGIKDLVIWGYKSSEGGTEQRFMIFPGRETWDRTLLLGSAPSNIVFTTNHIPVTSRFILDTSGDLNGDGVSDLVIGDPYNGCSGQHRGMIYIFLGRSDWGSETGIESADAYSCGENDWDEMGYSVSPGDVNGDGYDDLLLMSFENDQAGYGAGKVYLIKGSASGLSGEIRLSSSIATFLGEGTSDNLGYGGGGGDFNHDGIEDLLLGSPYHSVYTGMKGRLYYLNGRPSGWATNTSISTADIYFEGENDMDGSGKMNLLSDINGDGFADIVTGSSMADHEDLRDCGKVYIIFGRTGMTGGHLLSDADASFRGEASTDYLGYAIASGYFNIDPKADLIVSAYQKDDVNSTNIGMVYLLYGKTEGWGRDLNISQADAKFKGVSAGGKLGVSVSAGDIDGDSRDDIIMGAESVSGSNGGSGRFYIFFGK